MNNHMKRRQQLNHNPKINYDPKTNYHLASRTTYLKPRRSRFQTRHLRLFKTNHTNIADPGPLESQVICMYESSQDNLLNSGSGSEIRIFPK
jgi:hypothetical protein